MSSHPRLKMKLPDIRKNKLSVIIKSIERREASMQRFQRRDLYNAKAVKVVENTQVELFLPTLVKDDNKGRPLWNQSTPAHAAEGYANGHGRRAKKGDGANHADGDGGLVHVSPPGVRKDGPPAHSKVGMGSRQHRRGVEGATLGPPGRNGHGSPNAALQRQPTAPPALMGPMSPNGLGPHAPGEPFKDKEVVVSIATNKIDMIFRQNESPPQGGFPGKGFHTNGAGGTANENGLAHGSPGPSGASLSPHPPHTKRKSEYLTIKNYTHGDGPGAVSIWNLDESSGFRGHPIKRKEDGGLRNQKPGLVFTDLHALEPLNESSFIVKHMSTHGRGKGAPRETMQLPKTTISEKTTLPVVESALSKSYAEVTMRDQALHAVYGHQAMNGIGGGLNHGGYTSTGFHGHNHAAMGGMGTAHAVVGAHAGGGAIASAMAVGSHGYGGGVDRGGASEGTHANGYLGTRKYMSATAASSLGGGSGGGSGAGPTGVHESKYIVAGGAGGGASGGGGALDSDGDEGAELWLQAKAAYSASPARGGSPSKAASGISPRRMGSDARDRERVRPGMIPERTSKAHLSPIHLGATASFRYGSTNRNTKDLSIVAKKSYKRSNRAD